MSDEERQHADLQRQLGDVLAWIRQREHRGERVSDEFFHLVHAIEHRAFITTLRGQNVGAVTDEQAYAIT